jgi:hypothetical protein
VLLWAFTSLALSAEQARDLLRTDQKKQHRVKTSRLLGPQSDRGPRLYRQMSEKEALTATSADGMQLKALLPNSGLGQTPGNQFRFGDFADFLVADLPVRSEVDGEG